MKGLNSIMRAPFISFITALFIVGTAQPMSVKACDTCGCSFNAAPSEGQTAGGGMITTPTASTLGQGHATVGFLFEHQTFQRRSAEEDFALNQNGHDVHGKDHEEYYNLSAGYGLLNNLDVFLTAPIVSKTSIQIGDEDALGRKEHATGIGDMRLVGKYRFWEKGINAAVILGVKAPTGLTSKHNSVGEKFEPELQPGSGSWDFTTGLTASRSFQRHFTLANAFQYTYRGEGSQDEKLGDVFHYDLGVSYALKPLGQHPNLSLVLELHNEWARRDHNRTEDRVLDSGGTTILLSPGLSAALTKGLSTFFAMPIPIYEHLGGKHEKIAYEVISGVSWHF